jgi:hypothetical protein
VTRQPVRRAHRGDNSGARPHAYCPARARHPNERRPHINALTCGACRTNPSRCILMRFRGPDRISHLGLRQRSASLCGLHAFLRQAPQVIDANGAARIAAGREDITMKRKRHSDSHERWTTIRGSRHHAAPTAPTLSGPPTPPTLVNHPRQRSGRLLQPQHRSIRQLCRVSNRLRLGAIMV